MSFPRMSWHIGDYHRDTGHLRAAGHGAYFLLCMHYWATGGLPNDDKQLAAIARMSDKEWKEHKPLIEPLFKLGNWKHKRIEEELDQAQKKYDARANAGQKGGNAKAKGKQNPSNATAKSYQPITDNPNLEEPQSNLHPLHPEPQDKIFSIEKSDCEKGVKKESLEIPTFLKREPEALPAKPPRHGAITPDKRFVYFKKGTKEFEAYAEDYREAKGDEPAATNDGRWFRVLGESFLHNGKAKAANPNGYGMVDENGA